MANRQMTTPLDALTRYCADHPADGETVRFTAAGFVPGAALRRAQLLWVAVAVAIIIAVVVLALTDLTFIFAVLIGVVGAVVIVGLVLAVAKPFAPGANTLAVRLTDRRLLIARGRANDDPAIEAAAPDVTWAEVDDGHQYWLRGKRDVAVLTLGGQQGALVAIEMGTVDTRALGISLDEAGIARRS